MTFETFHKKEAFLQNVKFLKAYFSFKKCYWIRIFKSKHPFKKRVLKKEVDLSTKVDISSTN